MTPRLPPDNARGSVGISRRDIEALTHLSTPRVCDALEHAAPERRAAGHTTRALDCAHPALAPVAGPARTALVSTAAPCPDAAARHAAWLQHLASGPKPAILVWQDIDGPDAIGACWDATAAVAYGALGCVGLVTDGALRGGYAAPAGLQVLHCGHRPAGGWLHIVAFGCEVSVAGMTVRDGDIVHADRHGAVVVPEGALHDLPEVARGLHQRDADLIAACTAPGAGIEGLRPLLTRRYG
jgi:regulator of RNase E activity RraA